MSSCMVTWPHVQQFQKHDALSRVLRSLASLVSSDSVARRSLDRSLLWRSPASLVPCESSVHIVCRRYCVPLMSRGDSEKEARRNYTVSGRSYRRQRQSAQFVRLGRRSRSPNTMRGRKDPWLQDKFHT